MIITQNIIAKYIILRDNYVYLKSLGFPNIDSSLFIDLVILEEKKSKEQLLEKIKGAVVGEDQKNSA